MEHNFSRILSSLTTPSWQRIIFLRRIAALCLLCLAAGSYLNDKLNHSAAYVVVSTHLAPGSIIATQHLNTVQLPKEVQLPDTFDTIDEAVGKVVATPLAPGDVLNRRHVIGPELSAALSEPDSTLVPIKLVDPAAAELAVPGSVVTVLTASGDNPSDDPANPELSSVVAEGARVIFGSATASDTTEAGTILLALDQAQARNVATVSLEKPLTVVLTPVL